MKRVARILGLVVAVAVVVWAMRDRFVSIAAPREPEAPGFRVVTTPAAPPAAEASSTVVADAPAEAPNPNPDDLTEVVGIGPVFARRLMEAGITTFSELAGTSADRVAEVTGVPGSKAADWIEQAAKHD